MIMVSSTRKVDVYRVVSWVRMCSPGVSACGVSSSTEVRQRAMTGFPDAFFLAPKDRVACRQGRRSGFALRRHGRRRVNEGVDEIRRAVSNKNVAGKTRMSTGRAGRRNAVASGDR